MSKPSASKPLFKKILRILSRIVLSILILFILLILFVRSPWGQDLIIEKVTKYVSEKIDTKFEIGKLYLSFSGNLTIEELLLEDTSQDTLMYSRYLEADVPLYPIVFGHQLKVDLVDWKGLKANVSRKDSIEGFNFQFIIDAFASSPEENPRSNKEETPLDVSLGVISFEEFQLSYQDEVTGIDTELTLGKFYLESKSIDLEAMKFQLSELNLENTSITYHQFKHFESENTEEESDLPWIIVDDLSIKKLDLRYNSSPEDTKADVFLDEFAFSNLDTNLNLQTISLQNLVLRDSQFALEVNSNSSESEVELTDKPQKPKDSFSWPKWTVEVGEVDVVNNSVSILQNGKQPVKGEFSTEALSVIDLNFKAESILLSKEEDLSFTLNNFQFKEESGIEVREFKVNAILNSKEIRLNELRFKVNTSLVYADLNLNYASIQALIDDPLQSTFDLVVSDLQLHVADAYVFLPELKSNAQINALASHNFKGNFKAKGSPKSMAISTFDLNWGKDTRLKLSGTLENVTDSNPLSFNFERYTAHSSRADMSKFISAKELGISIPKTINVKGSLKKEAIGFSTSSELEIPEGIVKLNGNFQSEPLLKYAIDLEVNSLKLGELFQNPEVGNLSLRLSSKGEGESINDLSAELTSTIDSLRWNTYTFSGLQIEGALKKGKGDVKFDYSDENIQMELVSELELDSVSSKVDLIFDLKGIRTQNLGLTDKDLKAKVLANLQFEGNSTQFEFDAQLKEGLVVYDQKPYYLGKFDFTSKVDATKTTTAISSEFLNGSLEGNASVNRISKALGHHFERYANDSLVIENPKKPVILKLNLSFIESPILSDIFLEGIQKMDTLRSTINFNESSEKLSVNLNLPYINYQGNEIHGLIFDFNSEETTAEFNLGFDHILAGPIDIATTDISGQFLNKKLNVDLKAFKDEKEFFNSTVHIDFEENGLYRLYVSPENLILNGSSWSILENNEIVYQPNRLKISDFKLSREVQEIVIGDNFDEERTHVGIDFKNFKLSSITSYLNPDESLASGELSGNFIIIEPFTSKGLLSNLKIEDLKVVQVPIGNFKLQAEARSEDDYELNVSLKDGGIDFNMDGFYHTNIKESNVDFDFVLNTLELNSLEQFAPDYLKDTEGEVKGEFKINGKLDHINYTGFLAFKDARFNPKTLNTIFKLKDERIDLKKGEVSLSNFTIQDEDGNKFTVNGSMGLEEFTNPKFNLSFDAKNFQVLDSTIEDNSLYYGKLIFDASAKLKGDLEFPKIDLDLRVNGKSDLTYSVPESRASIEEREGIVIFVNKENPDNILTQQKENATDAVISGIELNSTIKIQKKSKVKVVINKRTDDNISIEGGGDFKFDIARNGNMNLVGKYEVSKGSVELNFYNVVKRKFEIAPSSSISWSGNPYNADLNLRAIYNIETSASSLMASQTAGENAFIQNRYKQQLPFMVYMDVGGELMSPDLSFQLDMPEESQGAINGSVYGKLSQINQQDDKLNKQVFSLLVLNKFYPESGSDGSQGGVASMARDNLNQALSDQLNTFSDKLMGNSGINLNFDLTSYTDYQGSDAMGRTDLDVTAQKKLFDERLVVEAGSQMNVEGGQRPGESQAVLGNVSVEYLLTQDGRWKLRGFRKSEYENVIDGQVFISGIALIFTREFNKFKVLWDKAYRKSLKAESVNRKRIKNKE
ncbi:translocation/assembly module TamB [Psychroflexus sp. MES1-P1E]|nr:translocation/assembly module TamB [Psychroflexus sp. MES1-P1E]